MYYRYLINLAIFRRLDFLFCLIIFITVMTVVYVKEHGERGLERASKCYGIASFIGGSLVLTMTIFLHRMVIERLGELGAMVYGGLIIMSVVVLGLLSICLASIGIFLGRRVKRRTGFVISFLGLIYNILVFAYSFWSIFGRLITWELKKLEKGFLVSLSRVGLLSRVELVVVYTLVCSVGAVVSFCGVRLVYKLLLKRKGLEEQKRIEVLEKDKKPKDEQKE